MRNVHINREIKRWVAKHTKSDKILQIAATSLDSKTQRGVVNNGNSVLSFFVLAKNGYLCYRVQDSIIERFYKNNNLMCALAGNPGLSDSSFRKLIDLRDPFILDELAKNKYLGEEFQFKVLLHGDERVYKSLANNPSISEEAARYLYNRYPDEILVNFLCNVSMDTDIPLDLVADRLRWLFARYFDPSWGIPSAFREVKERYFYSDYRYSAGVNKARELLG